MAFSLSIRLLLIGLTALQDGPPINHTPPVVIGTQELADWRFVDGSSGWQAEHHCRVTQRSDLLSVVSTGEDPFFHRDMRDLGSASGELKLVFRARSSGVGSGSIYWATHNQARSEDNRVDFRLHHDGQWHSYEVPFTTTGDLVDLRIDPGTSAGQIDFAAIRLVREVLHPLSFERIRSEENRLSIELRNAGDTPRDITLSGEQHRLPSHTSVAIAMDLARQKPLESIALCVRSQDLPDLCRSVCIHHADVAIEDPIERDLGEFSLQVARDGSVARLLRNEQIVGFMGPLLVIGQRVPALRLTETTSAELIFEAESARIALQPGTNQIAVRIRCSAQCEGPVVFATGELQQGLLAGVEYLGRNEKSSTKLDVETDASYRFAPDPFDITMPLMVFVTSRASVALTWHDMTLQPTFATPDFVSGTKDHRMSLVGGNIDAVIRLGDGPLEQTILGFAQHRGLPAIPQAPRTPEEQWKICLDALLTGPLRDQHGWGHCAEPNWTRQPYADMASTIWRLTGEVPPVERLVRGGSHVSNDAIFFVTGRARQWLEERKSEVQRLIAEQQPDGSFRYRGPFRRGHFEDTASGQCALPARKLLDFARLTGDVQALEAGLRTLKFMMRFRTPRGAQVWEVPLHTPDLLASAHLVGAYTTGFELTGDRGYLDEARRWAASGLPFVYQWSCRPIMTYATPPVFGATHWKAPVWIGLPVQWVGVVYAYELVHFAQYDETLNWKQLAEGILRAAEQMQYPDGPLAGLLPDAYRLETQERLPASINPCSLVSLRQVLSGRLDNLAVLRFGENVVVSPFPIRRNEGEIQIDARPGARYEVLIDGSRIVPIESRGTDSLKVQGGELGIDNPSR
jgi:hypothetical protein